MKLAPGSLGWLVWWDLRIRIRTLGFGRGRLRPLLLYGAFIVLLHGAAGFVLLGIFKNGQLLARDLAPKLDGLLLLYLLMFMLMAAGLNCFRLIFAGREFSLHLSSPLPFARVLWMRVLALVAATWSVSILLVAPVANMGALLGHPVFLLAYPVTVGVAVCTVATALLLMTLTVSLLGVPRARMLLQVSQALVPLLFVLLTVVGPHGSPRGAAHLNGGALSAYADWLRWPARALTGDPTALAGFALLSAAALWLSVRLAGAAVLTALQVPDAASPKLRAAAGPLHFRTDLFRVLVLKEWRTILRDPRLAGALLIQPLIVLPFFYLNLMHGRFKLAGAVAAATFVAAQMSQYVSNLMVSAEEAPTLLGAAPLPRGRVIFYKCVAALLPVLALMLVASAWIAAQDLWAGFACMVCCLGATFCACAIEVARPYPAPRRSFVQLAAARRKRDPVDVLSVLIVQFGWTAGAWFLAGRSWWGALIVFGILLVPFFEWWRDANRQALLGY